MNDEYVIREVIKYYEDFDYPFSYSVAGALDAKSDISKEWKNLFIAYKNGEFTPGDCRFMFGFIGENYD